MDAGPNTPTSMTSPGFFSPIIVMDTEACQPLRSKTAVDAIEDWLNEGCQVEKGMGSPRIMCGERANRPAGIVNYDDGVGSCLRGAFNESSLLYLKHSTQSPSRELFRLVI